MKNVFRLLKYGETPLAYLRVVNEPCVKDLRSELQHLSQYQNSEPSYDECRVLRIAFRKGYIYSDLEDFFRQWEGGIIASENWKDIQKLIEEAKLNTETLAFLLMEIFDHKEIKEARKVMLRYHELYDLNSVEYPEKIKGICQQMAAEIAIYDSTHQDSEETPAEEK